MQRRAHHVGDLPGALGARERPLPVPLAAGELPVVPAGNEGRGRRAGRHGQAPAEGRERSPGGEPRDMRAASSGARAPLALRGDLNARAVLEIVRPLPLRTVEEGRGASHVEDDTGWDWAGRKTNSDSGRRRCGCPRPRRMDEEVATRLVSVPILRERTLPVPLVLLPVADVPEEAFRGAEIRHAAQDASPRAMTQTTISRAR